MTASAVVLWLVTSVALAVILAAAGIGWFAARDQARDQVGSRDNRCGVAIHTTTPPTFAHCTAAAVEG